MTKKEIISKVIKDTITLPSNHIAKKLTNAIVKALKENKTDRCRDCFKNDVCAFLYEESTSSPGLEEKEDFDLDSVCNCGHFVRKQRQKASPTKGEPQ